MRCEFAFPSFNLALSFRLAQPGQFFFDFGGATLRFLPSSLFPLRICGLAREDLALAGVGFPLRFGGAKRGQFALRLRSPAIGFLELSIGVIARRDLALARFGFTLRFGFAERRQFPLRLGGTTIGFFTQRLSLTTGRLLALRFDHQALCDFAERAALRLFALSLHLAIGRQFLLRCGGSALGFLALGFRCLQRF